MTNIKRRLAKLGRTFRARKGTQYNNKAENESKIKTNHEIYNNEKATPKTSNLKNHKNDKSS